MSAIWQFLFVEKEGPLNQTVKSNVTVINLEIGTRDLFISSKCSFLLPMPPKSDGSI